MDSNTIRKANMYDKVKKISHRIAKGRWYLKDLEQIGAKITLTPHRTSMGHHQYLYSCQLEIEGREYYLIVRETPLLSKYIYAVNCKRHPGKEQQAVAEHIVRCFNEAYKENKNGIRMDILKRNFYILTGQLGIIITWFSTPLLIAKYFFSHTVNYLALGGISFSIFVVSFILILLAKKDSKFGGQ